MTLDDTFKIAQIGFYGLIAFVTVLTFWRAKEGLLNSVNTEYHKKVIERLEDLSKVLLDEYDWDSPNHWSNKHPVAKIVSDINKNFMNHKEEILQRGSFPGIPSHPDYERLKALVQRVKSDPFIPKAIRSRVTDLLENRADVILDVHLDHFERYKTALAKGKYSGDLDNNAGWIQNEILADLRKRGCGIEEIEHEVHEIRLAIQTYFERFDPDS
jgi:hypothetical protein